MTYRVISKGETESIKVYAVDKKGTPLTGKTDLFIRIQRSSDNWFLDWNDKLFKSSGHGTLNQILTEVDATNAPGLYEVTDGFDSGPTNLAVNDALNIIPLQTPGTDAMLPSPAELQVRETEDAVYLWEGNGNDSGTGRADDPLDTLVVAAPRANNAGHRTVIARGEITHVTTSSYSFILKNWQPGLDPLTLIIYLNSGEFSGWLIDDVSIEIASGAQLRLCRCSRCLVTSDGGDCEDTEFIDSELIGLTGSVLNLTKATRSKLSGNLALKPGTGGAKPTTSTPILSDCKCDNAQFTFTNNGLNTRLLAFGQRGTLTLLDLKDSSGSAEINLIDGGVVTINASCDNGTIIIRGSGSVIDNHTGSCTVIDLTLSSGVWDALQVDHTATGSFGELAALFTQSIGRVSGLLHENSIVDNQVYDSVGLLTSARLRVFDSAGNLPDTPGGSEVTGLLFEYIVIAGYVEGLLNEYKIKRVI